MTIRKITNTLVTCALIAFTGQTSASAEETKYPSGPVNYIIPFAPGGESDTAARFQQKYWQKITGENLIIQNQAGAGGAQAWSQLNGLADDGSTIMITNLPHIVLQPVAGSAGYQTEDITNVNFFHYTPDAIIVGKDSPFQTLQDLIDYAKKNPGLVTFAGSGTNSANQLAQVKFDELADITTTYIPFGGTAPAVTAALGGQVSAAFVYSTSGVSQGESVRVLAVGAEERLSIYPNVPTFTELGFDMIGGSYRGVAIPSSASEEVRQEVSDLVSQINADPEFRAQMEQVGFVLIDVPYADVPNFMAERTEEYMEGARALGIVK
ncbi:tripartite tricarboxylate transporter substrate binding protein [Puniceibacterium sp. IMCC21224]|uniref:tripartite tricarboxylate transporter substrate binding protein n=1 Tax=Puniceibacterium sp. IMCC21224 TaxID=1618204 RepID=UPI00064DCD8F|nr:tripartite tricarboxylate transporter substrate binding protein [Puniceibacterium sp. IMCC21224]KMK69084.1 hypothetical protein IMCC21224_113972 [Puniceibacterium sp. IMCC21224]